MDDLFQPLIEEPVRIRDAAGGEHFGGQHGFHRVAQHGSQRGMVRMVHWQGLHLIEEGLQPGGEFTLPLRQRTWSGRFDGDIPLTEKKRPDVPWTQGLEAPLGRARRGGPCSRLCG